MQRVFDVSAHITGYTFDTKYGTRPNRIDVNGHTYHLRSAGITISIGRGKHFRQVMSCEIDSHTINLRHDSRGWSVFSIC